MNRITLNNKKYEIIDTKEHITIPDCFVKDSNKIGSGHGEAKFYVGQETDNITLNFFDYFNVDINCVIKKSILAWRHSDV